jgi:ATP-binding cassette subfamily C protein CydCD
VTAVEASTARSKGPLDRRILALSPALRTHLVVCGAVAVAVAAAVLVQAEAIARLLPRLIDGDTDVVVPLSGWLLLAGVVRGASAFVVERSSVRTLIRTRQAIRRDILDRLRTVGPLERAQLGPARVAALTTTATDALEPWVRTYLPTLMLAAVVPVAAGLRILGADLLSAVILAVCVPLIPVFMVLIGLATEIHTKGQWAALQRLADRFLDVLTGLPTLRLFGRADAQVARVREVTDRYRRATMSTLRVAFLSALVLELLATLSVAIIAVSLGARLSGGDLSLRTALTVLLLAPECLLPLRRVGAAFHASTAGLDAAVEVEDVLGLPVAPAGAEAAVDGPLVARQVEVVDAVRGRRLDPIDLSVASGQIVAVIGRSGSGKSTLLETLRGALAPTGGTVTLGGRPVADVEPEERRRAIRWVPARPAPLGATVLGSAGLGLDVADERVAAATGRWLRALGLAPLADRRPEQLSGGESRRLAFARALATVEVGGARFLLLDEPTAQLDAERVAAVLDAIRWVAGRGVGVVVVTHDKRVGGIADALVRVGRGSTPAADSAPPEPVRAESARIETSATSTSSVHAAAVQARTGGELPLAAEVVGDLDLRDHRPIRSARRWLFRLARPNRGRLLAAQAIGVLTEACAVALTATAAWLIVRAGEHPNFADLALAAVGVRAFAVGKAVFRYGERLASHDATLRVLADARAAVVGRLARLAPTGLSDRGRGELLARLVDDIDRLQDLFLRVLGPVVAGLLVAAGAVAFTAYVDPTVGLTLAAAVLVTGIVLPALAHRLAVDRGAVVAGAKGAVTAEVVSIVEGGEELVAVGAEPGARDEVERRAARVDALDRRQGRASAIIAAVVAAAPAFATAAVAVAAGSGAHRMSGPALGILVLLPVAVMELLAPLTVAGESLARVDASLRRVHDLIERPDPVTEPAVPAVAPASAALALDAVTVGWPDGPDVLTGATLAIPDGGRRVLMGPSGSGKSTVAALLVGFLAPRAGRVEIGGVATFGSDGLDGDTIRRTVTWCQQDPWFASSTVADNLRIASAEATDDDLRRAVATAGLEAWLDALPDGLETHLARDAADLSGGERQRLAVARVLLGGQRAVVLDEPTAHLDPPTAAALLADVDAALTGTTLLVIGHDPALTDLGPVTTVRAGTLVGTDPDR